MTIALTTELVKQALQNTNAHGLARLVHQKQLYVRILWLLAWLICCGLFLRQFAGFIIKLRLSEVTTSFQANAAPFEYPALYFCFDSPMSGSLPLILSDSNTASVNESFSRTVDAFARWKAELQPSEVQLLMEADDEASVKLNSLPYRFLADEMGHTVRQSLLLATMTKSDGLAVSSQRLKVTEFYHPMHLRCFNVSLNATQREAMLTTSPGDSLDFLVMLDAPDSRMGRPNLPAVSTTFGNLTAPYWALDTDTLYNPFRWSAVRVYTTQPGRYPSQFSSYLLLEAGRFYTAELTMAEQVHNEDPNGCVDEHPDVQLVNPYDNSPYTVAYDYAYCYNSAVQTQLQRELNATLAHLPHPWPLGNRLLYNLSSKWGSLQHVRQYLAARGRMRPEEAQERCASAHRCTERTYTASVNSVVSPSADSFDSFLSGIALFYPDNPSDAPALHYLRSLASASMSGSNTSQQQMTAAEYVRANFLILRLKAAKPKADRTVYSVGYSFESFVADIGGILGIYLGMSVLTAVEIMQFLHDLFLMAVAGSRGTSVNESDSKDEKTKEQSFSGMGRSSSTTELGIWQQAESS